MRILVTGMSGTVAPRFHARARDVGHEVLGWDRGRVSPDDPGACQQFLAATAPTAIVHMAFGAEAWAGLLAGAAAERSIPFVLTSTSMVFAQRPDGPYPIDAPRTATDDYGSYKVRCEDAVLGASAEAMVARLGYQIDQDGHGNNMLAHLDAEQDRTGRVRASTRWIPAAAFLDDTAAALLGLLEGPSPGVHHLDGNAGPAWTHARIVAALAEQMGRAWHIEQAAEPVHDQRLLGSERITAIDTRLS